MSQVRCSAQDALDDLVASAGLAREVAVQQRRDRARALAAIARHRGDARRAGRARLARSSSPATSFGSARAPIATTSTSDGPARAVDSADAEDLALGLGDVHVPGSDDLVDPAIVAVPKASARDRLRAADRVQLVDPHKAAGVENRRIDRTVRLRRRDDDDAFDAGDLGRHDRHQHGRRQRRAAARDVGADAVQRPRQKRVLGEVIGA
jgi:hypothetical protein